MTIRIITEPKIYIINRQSVDHAQVAKFLEDEGVSGWATDAPSAAEFGVEFGGRLCYMSFKKPRPGGNAGYINHILEVGHGSVTEHAVWTFVITGISRRCCEQLTRQRVGFSPSQLSQRYVDETEGGSFDAVLPPLLSPFYPEYARWKSVSEAFAAGVNHQNVDGPPEMTPGAAEIADWLSDVELATTAYDRRAVHYYDLLGHIRDKTARRKKAREAARGVLPNETETKIQATVNARSLRHFIEMRGDHGADEEIRRLAFMLLPVMLAEAPHLFGDYGIDRVGGVDVIRTPYRKI